MIRREIELADEGPVWLLVSQVEHAHVSGELARHWPDEFSSEVVAGITHHDDGWAVWEAAPKLSPEIGAPYSFLEMPVTESLVIWDNSIAAARKIGPLAGWIVAGHFYELLSKSDHAGDPAAIAWLTAKRKVRTTWLDEWVRADSSHTLDYARRAQEMLLMADLFSLWLCCDCPTPGTTGSILEQSAMKLRNDVLRRRFRFAVTGFGRRHPTPDNPHEALAWIVAVEPYPFKTSPLSLTAKAMAAPAAHYGSWPELVAASRTIEIRWRLVADANAASSAS